MFLREPKRWKVYQMGADRSGPIPVIGTYQESLAGGVVPTAIEARWGNGPWSVVDANPDTVNRSFSGVLADQQVHAVFPWRQDVQVRFQNAPEILLTVPKVGVGIQIVGEGQSNMVQWFGLVLNSTATEASTAWLSTDPMDPNAIRPANDPLNGCWPGYLLAAGSMNPELMDRIALSNDAPVMYVGAAVSGSNLTTQWQSGNPRVYEPVVHNIRNAMAGQNCPALRIRLQGESEVDDFTTPQYDGLTTEEYEEYYLRYEDDLAADLGCSVPVVLGVIGRLDQPANHYSFEMVEPVRRALRELVGMRPQILAGPETVNCPMTNGIHFDRDAKQCLLDSFCASIDATGVVACY